MPTQVNRRDFLLGAEALALAAVLNRAYARLSPEDVAADENYWNTIRRAYVPDPTILNLNNGGVAPSPTTVLEAEIEMRESVRAIGARSEQRSLAMRKRRHA